MKQLMKYMLITVMVLAAVAGATTAFAAPGDGGGRGRPGGPGGRGPGGEVTAVGASSITIVNRNDEEVVVNVDDETTIHLVETQSEGSLNDIDVGDQVKARGQRNDDGTVNARSITVMPKGDRLGGKVTAVNGSTLSVENRDGTATINAAGATVYVNGEAASLSDITADMGVHAYGETQDDGSLNANLVLAKSGCGGGDGRPERPGRGSDSNV